MKKSSYSEQSIITSLKEIGLDAKINETCHKYGISDAIYYKWKSASNSFHKKHPANV